jgi:hypothetical protein
LLTEFEQGVELLGPCLVVVVSQVWQGQKADIE